MLTTRDLCLYIEPNYDNLTDKEKLKVTYKIKKILVSNGYTRFTFNIWAGDRYKGIIPLTGANKCCDIFGLNKNKYLKGYSNKEK